MRFFPSDDGERHGDKPRRRAASPKREEQSVAASSSSGQAVEDLLLREIGAALVDDGFEQGPLTIPQPVAAERVIEWAADCGYDYFLDSDGDVGGLWQGRVFYFLLAGANHQILHVRGQWNREITIERLEEVLEFCNEWNAHEVWPKAYTRVRDDGMIQVYCAVTADLEHGVTDDQLDQLLQCGLTTGSAFFDVLDDFYPDPARRAP